MDEKPETSTDTKDTKSPPARPPPPGKLKSSQSVDCPNEKTPPVRPSQPKHHSFGGGEIPPSVQKHLDELRELQKHKVRWFYKEGKKWLPFNGRDSLVIEEEWQALKNESNDGDMEKCYRPTVRGRLFEVDVNERMCHPLYWKGMVTLLQFFIVNWIQKHAL